MVDEVTVDAAVAIDERMDVDKPEGQTGGSDHGIKGLCCSPVKDHRTVDPGPPIFCAGADISSDRQARTAVMFTDKPSFLPESKLHEARVADHDSLHPQELFKIDRGSPSLSDGLPPAPDPILRRALSFDGETRSRVLQEQEGRGAHEQILGQ